MMLTYKEALKMVLDTATPLPSIEVPLQDGLGMVLAEPVQALWDQPSSNNSAMDGYAFAWRNHEKEAQLEVIGFVGAGSVFSQPVNPGQAVKIMTGAHLPAGCDTVVPVEDVREEGNTIRLSFSPERGQHVRFQGEEFTRGETLLAAEARIHSGEIGLLAACGASRIKVHPAPRVAVLSTGDELVELGHSPGMGQIVNSNIHLLASRLREEGCEVSLLGIGRDNPADLRNKLLTGLQSDMLITTGGVSVGDRDYVQEVLETIGFKRKFWKVAIKPGKPVLFGTAGETLVFGLPGNPAASAATFELFALPALRRMAGGKEVLLPQVRATLLADVKGGGSRQRFLWGGLNLSDGDIQFTPSTRQGSGQHRSLQGARALLPMPGGSDDLAAGSTVRVIALRLPAGSSEY